MGKNFSIVCLLIFCASKNIDAQVTAQVVAPTKLPLYLVGTIILRNQSESIATIKARRQKNKRTTFREKSELLKYGKVTKIGRQDVTFLNYLTKKFEKIPLGQFDGSKKLTAKKMDKGESSFHLKREKIDSLLENLHKEVYNAGSAPVYGRQGEIVGYRITFVKKNSIWSRLGIRKDDVVKRVNGIAIDSPLRVLELLRQLKDSSLIELELQRKSHLRKIEYLIR
ncbi:hypothetical protein COB52_04730 [Candidatus Kaiserbacteria bacterium]|nr:MAG: hypothetical protein COB52_04730 [Candidatus Kaiserbacteria bacterium]